MREPEGGGSLSGEGAGVQGVVPRDRAQSDLVPER